MWKSSRFLNVEIVSVFECGNRLGFWCGNRLGEQIHTVWKSSRRTNPFIEMEESGLSKNGVVNIYRISTIDKRRLTERVCVLSQGTMSEIDYGLKLLLNIQ
ncbi:MAG: type II toxin-antitoxin system PemK/MazF family toxin [Spirochaetia bacterium]|nr:type II toxin-antitoxin system PemK/MazF family toxin [Spirochaetia bacterium]